MGYTYSIKMYLSMVGLNLYKTFFFYFIRSTGCI